MAKFLSLFNSNYPVIGAHHFKPMVGYKGFVSFDDVLDVALQDLRAFEQGGVDAVIIENNYDLPHHVTVNPETVVMMTKLGNAMAAESDLVFGVDVLWNDYRASLNVAKAIGAKFIRISAFVDDVESDYGVAHAVAKEAIAYRESIGATEICILTDVQVKHAKMIDATKPLSRSVTEAVEQCSDGIIVTGTWTGKPPTMEDMDTVKSHAGSSPIVIGSGARRDNMTELMQYSDAVIVGTALKFGRDEAREINVKSYDQRVNRDKVVEFMETVRGRKS